MRLNSSTCLLILGAATIAAAASVACSSPPPSDAEGATAAATRDAFDRNAVLDDGSLVDAEAMSEADIQKFLDRTPWGTKSVLASYEGDGKTAAQIIHAAATKHGINPLELLVRVQMEQGLISKKTAAASTIDIAFGCGCPHSAVCSDRYMGFANQAECAAGTLARSLAAAKTTKGTVSGWARSRAKETQDGIMITPKNAATAALYTYTPWVGEAGGGREGVGGVSLHHAVWDRFATAVSYGAWATGTTEPTTPTSASSDASTMQTQADAGSEPDAEQPQEGEGRPDPEPEPEREPTPTPTPTNDAGTTADAASTSASPDAGNEAPLPSDGSEDDAVLAEGNAPPASNAPPPKATSRRSPEDLPEATEEELSSKKKTSDGGCSMSGGGSASTDGALFALGLAAGVMRARRRRKADGSA